MQYLTLNQLEIGNKGNILNINKKCNNRLRLLDLGFTYNTDIYPIWNGFGKKITAYLIKGTLIALRSDEAKHINVIQK